MLSAKNVLCLALRMETCKQLAERLRGRDFVLPDSDDLETVMVELPVDAPPPRNVGPQLGDPILSATLRQWAGALRATVPEAAVDEDSQIQVGEYEVRGTGNRADVHLPAADTLAHQRGPNFPLGRAVAFGAHTAHLAAALLFGQDVHPPGPRLEYKTGGCPTSCDARD